MPRLRPSLVDVSHLVFLRDRIRSLEKELLGVRGHADVWKWKAERGAAREEYLMGELRRLAEQLQCEFLRAAARFSNAPVGLSSYFVGVAGANLVPKKEKERVVVRINCLMQQDMEAG